MPAFSRQTKFSDGNIYYHLRKAQETKSWKIAQSYRVELTQCKEKILNQLIQHHLSGITEGCVAARSFIEALDLLLPYPGLLEGLELANWHRYLALHWDEPIVHFLSDHLYSTYELIVEGVAEARKYCDITTVRCLALRCPANKNDAAFIRKKLENGTLFPGLTDQQSRLKILDNILSIKVIIPSLKTFHENMKYFAIGARIIKEHLLDDDLRGAWNLPEKLSWTLPTNPTIEAANGHVPVSNMDQQLALKALFLTAIRSFPYLSYDKPKQDVRGEATVANVDPGFVYLLRAEAKRLGLSSSKIEKALTGQEPTPRSIESRDQEIYCEWKCGKPNLRAFHDLQKHAFLPDLASVHGKDGLVPLFVFRDFMEAFFGNDAFMIEIEPPEEGATGESASSLPAGGTRPKDVRRLRKQQGRKIKRQKLIASRQRRAGAKRLTSRSEAITDSGPMDVCQTPEQSDGNTLPSPTDRTRSKHSPCVRQKRHHPYNRAAKQVASISHIRQRRSRSSNEINLNQEERSMSEAEAVITDRDQMQRSPVYRRKSTQELENTRLGISPKPSKVTKKRPDKGKGKATAEFLGQLLSELPGSRKNPSQSVIAQPAVRIQPPYKRPGGSSTVIEENPRNNPPKSPFVAPPDLGLPSIATEEENPRDRPRSPPLVAPPSPPNRMITTAAVEVDQFSEAVASAALGLPESHTDRSPGKKRIVGTGVNTVEIRQPARTEPPLKRPRIATIVAPPGIATEEENLRDRRVSPPFVAPSTPSLPRMATEEQNSRDWQRSPPFVAPPDPSLPGVTKEQNIRDSPQKSPLAAPSPNATDRPRRLTAERRQRTYPKKSATQAGASHQASHVVSSGMRHQPIRNETSGMDQLSEARSTAFGRWLTPQKPKQPASPTPSVDIGMDSNRNKLPIGFSEPGKHPEAGKHETHDNIHQSQNQLAVETGHRAADCGETSDSFAQTRTGWWRDTALYSSSEPTP